MKIFIWERCDNVTYNWHHEGGLAIVAATLERARELSENADACRIPPDFEANVDATEEKVFIFPDKGCC